MLLYSSYTVYRRTVAPSRVRLRCCGLNRLKSLSGMAMMTTTPTVTATTTTTTTTTSLLLPLLVLFLPLFHHCNCCFWCDNDDNVNTDDAFYGRGSTFPLNCFPNDGGGSLNPKSSRCLSCFEKLCFCPLGPWDYSSGCNLSFA